MMNDIKKGHTHTMAAKSMTIIGDVEDFRMRTLISLVLHYDIQHDQMQAMRFSDFDFTNKKLKLGEQRVEINNRLIELIEQLYCIKEGPYVFADYTTQERWSEKELEKARNKSKLEPGTVGIDGTIYFLYNNLDKPTYNSYIWGAGHGGDFT